MTVLPDHEIERYSRCSRNLNIPLELIYPFKSNQLQPASYDCQLHFEILVPVPKISPVDLREPGVEMTNKVEIDHGHMLMPHQFVLGATKEWVNIPNNMVGRIEGKSSRARRGLQVHSAGYLDPGFRGNVTLELVNFAPWPILLYPDILIAQLSFEYLTSSCKQPYSSYRNHYQNSHGAVESRA